MARKYDAWGHSSWNQWWETEAKKFDALEAKCDWLRSMLEEKCDEMKRLDGEVTRLGQESKDLMQRVSEAEDVNAALERELADLRNGVAGASAAGVSEIPEAEAPGRAGSKREIPAEAPIVGSFRRRRGWHPQATERKSGSTLRRRLATQRPLVGLVKTVMEGLWLTPRKRRN